MADSEPPVDQECVEAYLFAGRPPKLLVLRRPPARGGYWVPVSGKVEATDPDLATAARREVEEETAFRAFLSFVSLDWQVRFPGPDGRRWQLHAFAGELAGEATPVLSDEHDGWEWVTADEAVRRLHFDDNRAAVRRLVEQVSRADAPNV